MNGISTHILDTASGTPAGNVRVRLYGRSGEIWSGTTGADGRCSAMLPPDVPLELGTYRLVFEIGEYFGDGFYPEVTISFLVRDTTAHYHVPLLISPFSFTTYRGS